MPTYQIKNMVCPRCITAVQGLFSKLAIPWLAIDLGKATLAEKISAAQQAELDLGLKELGFELLDDRQSKLINAIKSIIIQQIHYDQEVAAINISSLLTEQLHYDYAHLSRLFSSVEGRTIEKFVLAQKIEKVKELLSYQQLTLAEIAHQLGYSSSAHLSTQFKKITGMTPTAFKKERQPTRLPLDNL